MAILMRFPGFKRKVFTVSYDDGRKEDVRLANIMLKYGIKGTLNINNPISDGTKRITKEALADFIAQGVVEVAVHGRKHLSLALVDSGAAAYDVIKNREELEEAFGMVIKGMAYANGSYNDDVVELLKKCGIEYARTAISTEKFDMPADWMRLPTTCHHDNPRLMELARQFIEKQEERYFWLNTPMMFFVYGHSFEFERNGNWEVFEKLCEYVGGREDIWYATNGEIYEYDTAYKSLRISADERIIHNPTAIDVYLRIDNKNILVKAGDTVKAG